MANPTQTPKQCKIRRYIVGKLFPMCGKEPMKLNELQIAKKFSINRLTIRKACRDLLEEHSLITLPGKRGLFINPDYIRIRGKRRFIGILGTIPQMNILENNNFRILSAFDSAMDRCEGDYQFLALKSTCPEEMAEEILSYDLTALLWISPGDDSLVEVFEKVLNGGLSAVLVSPPYHGLLPPSSNAILFDGVAAGKMRAQRVRQENCKRPGYIAVNRNSTYYSFREEFPFLEKEYFMEPGKLRFAELAAWIRKKEIDSLVMDGTIVTRFADLCGKVPCLKEIDLFIDHGLRTTLLEGIAPEIHLHYFTGYMKRSVMAGRKAAQMMSHLLSTGEVRFPNQIVNVDESE